MELASMSNRLSTEFSQDRLFKTIQRMGIFDELFDEHIDNLIENHDYQTANFEEWYCKDKENPNYLCTPGTMRHWLNDLSSYIETRNVGRFVLMDHKGVFRLKMALLLRKHGLKLSLVAETAGVRSIGPVVLDPPEQTVTNVNQGDLNLKVLIAISQELMRSGLIKNDNGNVKVDLNGAILKALEENNILQLPEGIEEKIFEQKVTIDNYHREIKERFINLEKELSFDEDGHKQILDLYNQICSDDTNIEEKERLLEHLRLFDRPQLRLFSQMYAESAERKIMQYKQDKKELHIREIKELCLEIFNLGFNESATTEERQNAKQRLQKLHDENPELSFEIRSFIANLETKDKNKRKRFWLF